MDRNANSNDVFDGSSYIYCALRTCTQIGNDISGNSQQYDEFGYSIKLSNDGKVIVIGAPQSYGAENSTPTSASQIGYVEVYKYAENSNSWENISKTFSDNPLLAPKVILPLFLVVQMLL